VFLLFRNYSKALGLLFALGGQIHFAFRFPEISNFFAHAHSSDWWLVISDWWQKLKACLTLSAFVVPVKSLWYTLWHECF